MGDHPEVTRFEEFEQALLVNGEHYDSGSEEFRHGERVPDWEAVSAWCLN
jgi:hypothetical protein